MVGCFEHQRSQAIAGAQERRLHPHLDRAYWRATGLFLWNRSDGSSSRLSDSFSYSAPGHLDVDLNLCAAKARSSSGPELVLNDMKDLAGCH